MNTRLGAAVGLVLLCVVPATAAFLPPAQSADPRLVRIYVETDDDGDTDELAARQESLKDLTKALASKKKVLAVVEDDSVADVVVEVTGRGVDTPKFVIGVMARPGQPGGSTGLVRTAVLQVRFVLGEETITVTNKNKPNLTTGGWKSAAENIADQIEKVIDKRRTEILRRRGGVSVPAA